MRTNGEKYGPVMETTSKSMAKRQFIQLVEEYMRDVPGATREEAESVTRDNIGYYAGYYNAETQDRVRVLFGALHPVFDKAIRTG